VWGRRRGRELTGNVHFSETTGLQKKKERERGIEKDNHRIPYARQLFGWLAREKEKGGGGVLKAAVCCEKKKRVGKIEMRSATITHPLLFILFFEGAGDKKGYNHNTGQRALKGKEKKEKKKCYWMGIMPLRPYVERKRRGEAREPTISSIKPEEKGGGKKTFLDRQNIALSQHPLRRQACERNKRSGVLLPVPRPREGKEKKGRIL